MDTASVYNSIDNSPSSIPYQTSTPARLLSNEENEFLARNQFRFACIFSGLWLSYCWWLSERFRFDFGRYTTVIRLLFCLIHVLTVWRFFQYIMKLFFRLYRVGRRLRANLPRHLTIIILSLVLFLLLTFVLHFKQFVRDAFAIVD